MDHRQITEKIKELHIASTALNQRYAAQMALYNAACLENNPELMDQHRASCLAVVEQILDSNAIQLMLTRQLLDMGPDLSGFRP